MKNKKSKSKKPLASKPVVSASLPNGYWFTNEHGSEITVMATKDNWCMVSKEGKKKPYVLPKEFVMAIRNEGNNR